MNRRGFTLVEILLVTAIVGGISIAVANAFNNGLRLWVKADALTRQSFSGLFLEQFAQDLRQVPMIATLKFKGTGQQITFPSIVMVEADKQGSRASEGMIDSIGAVRYRFDAATKTITRSQAGYGQALNNQYTQEIVVAQGIENVEFTYEVHQDDGFNKKETIDGGIPYAVNVRLTMMQDGVPMRLERICPIPLGGDN